MTNPTSTTASWEKEFDRIDGSVSSKTQEKYKSFIHSLLKENTTATLDAWIRENKPITNFTCSEHKNPIPTCFQCSEEIRLATLREVMEEVEKVKDRGYNHGYSVTKHIEDLIQHKLTSE